MFFDARRAYTSHRRHRRGRGKKKQAALLLAWGVRHRGGEELIDFRVTGGENEKNWTAFMTDLERRGLKTENPWAQRLEMIVSDGDSGLLSALYMVYPNVPKQRCVFHKVQDIAAHLQDRSHREAILSEAGRIHKGARTKQEALARLERWAQRWRQEEPEAVRCFLYDFERTLTYLNAPCECRRRLRTTSPIERFIRELNRKFKGVGSFPSNASWERATYLVWRNLKTNGYAPTTRQSPKTPSYTKLLTPSYPLCPCVEAGEGIESIGTLGLTCGRSPVIV